MYCSILTCFMLICIMAKKTKGRSSHGLFELSNIAIFTVYGKMLLVNMLTELIN